MEKFNLTDFKQGEEVVKNLMQEFDFKFLEKDEYLPEVMKYIVEQKKMQIYTITINLEKIPDKLWEKIYKINCAKYNSNVADEYRKLGLKVDDFILLQSQDMTINHFMMLKNQKEIRYTITTAIPITHRVLSNDLITDRFDPIAKTFQEHLRPLLCNFDIELSHEFDEALSISETKCQALGKTHSQPWNWFGFEKKYVGTFIMEGDEEEFKKSFKNLFDPYTFILGMCNDIEPTLFLNNSIYDDAKSIMSHYTNYLANEMGWSPREVITSRRLDILYEGCKGLIKNYVTCKQYMKESMKGELLAYVLDGLSDAIRRAYIQICIENGVPLISNILTNKYNQLMMDLFNTTIEVISKISNKKEFDLRNYIIDKIINVSVIGYQNQEEMDNMKTEVTNELDSIIERIGKKINGRNFDDEEEKILVN